MTKRRPPSLRRAGAALLTVALCSAVASAEDSPERSRAPTARGQLPSEPPSLPAITTRATSVEIEAPAPLRFLSGFAIEAAHPRWGGLSGVATAGDGDDFAVISDRGTVFTGRFVREQGGLAGVENLHSHTLRNPAGDPWSPEESDAEGLALAPEGALLVAFEGEPRLVRYAAPDAPAEPLALPPGARTLQKNSGLEALAIAPDGTLALLPERSGREDRPFPVWLRSPEGDWTQGAFEREPPFLVTDAAFGPEGRLYVLERDFGLLSWFRARIRRAAVVDGRVGPPVTIASLSGVDNLEGLDIRTDASGRLRLLVVSDDNFNPLQRTLFLEFELTESRSAAVDPAQ